jgi:hypothetical protein
MDTSYEYWDEMYIKIKKLRAQGLTFLQIEEETGYNYEDICWVIHEEELLDALKKAK